jgi:hypothetical protein
MWVDFKRAENIRAWRCISRTEPLDCYETKRADGPYTVYDSPSRLTSSKKPAIRWGTVSSPYYPERRCVKPASRAFVDFFGESRARSRWCLVGGGRS